MERGESNLTDFFLKWGNRKRLIRCARVRDPEISDPSDGGRNRIRRKITAAKENSLLQQQQQHARHTRNSDGISLRSESNHKSGSSSPDKEERFYLTRGSVVGLDENRKASRDRDGSGGGGDESRGHVWPKLYISLSSKEKEEDFMAMKGCKPPQRPKKRAKIIQRTLLLVSPGAWLTDMCQERYEVREKKISKKKPRGLKAMGSMDSDSD